MICTNIPLVGKHSIVFDTSNGKLSDVNVELIFYHLNGHVHIFLRQMFTAKVQEVLGSACNDYFIKLFGNNFYSISDQVSPGSCTRRKQKCIFFSFLNLRYGEGFRIFQQVSFNIKILIIKGYKFKK